MLFKIIFRLKIIFIFCIAIFSSLNVYAQQAFVNDDEMSGIFLTGGYGALFGGAMGAALLPFINAPTGQNIRMVAGGASLGFMIGTLYGFYSLADARKNSYFNYGNSSDDEDENIYYAMPPTIMNEGKNNLKINKKPNYIHKSISNEKLVGALLMGDGKNINLGIPCFWVGRKEISVMLAAVTF